MRRKIPFVPAFLATPILLVAVLALVGTTAASEPTEKEPAGRTLLGFAPERVEAELALEETFAASLDPANLDVWMKRLSAHPHHVGSPWGKANAEYMAELFRSWGYEVTIEEFHVLLPTPTERLLEMVEPEPFTASLEEPAIPEDSTSGQKDEQLPTYNAYSVDGDVTGELVFVGYGLPDDYDELAKRGISVEGKIALAKYGRSWRGIKPKVAAEHGAIGCIIYSDPADDGYGPGDPYPKGGFRPPLGAQRGSVMDMPQYTGDPLTPYIGARKDARRLDRSEVTVFTRIPVVPISYRDAQPLLAALGGPLAPPDWRGGLPLTYHLGPGPAKVHLKLAFSWDLVPAYDVVARLTGSERPEQWILRGNHHDAWVNGAADPISGMVTVLEEARALGELVKAGWRPKRTIVYAGWDGEEQGLLGSTEFAEAYAEELRQKAVVYINTDGYQRGFAGVDGSHTLEKFVNEVLVDVDEPELDMSVAERLRAVLQIAAPKEVQEEARSGAPLRLGALGSGSDYTPFLQHLGIAALNYGFGGEGEYGQYHSIYDSYDHFTRFMDPGFVYGKAMAELGGRMTLRLANADVVPFDFSRFAVTVGEYVDEVVKLADTMREKTEEENRRIDEGLYTTAADPRKVFVVPEKEAPVPFLNFAPLQNALAGLKAAIEAWEGAIAKRGIGDLSAAERVRLDEILYHTERALTREQGLPGRPWYRHHLYAPGFYTGYGVKTLPIVREAIEEREWSEVEAGIAVTAEVLRAFTAEVEKATAVVVGE